MAAMEASPRNTSRSVEFGRVVSFTDGIFAIAITLLVLNFDVPEVPGAPAAQVDDYLARGGATPRDDRLLGKPALRLHPGRVPAVDPGGRVSPLAAELMWTALLLGRIGSGLVDRRRRR